MTISHQCCSFYVLFPELFFHGQLALISSISYSLFNVQFNKRQNCKISSRFVLRSAPALSRLDQFLPNGPRARVKSINSYTFLSAHIDRFPFYHRYIVYNKPIFLRFYDSTDLDVGWQGTLAHQNLAPHPQRPALPPTTFQA